jgi:RND family efflux transporter MFP subunit
MKTTKILIYSLLITAVSFLHGCADNGGQENIINSEISVEVDKIKLTDGSETIAYSGTIEESESFPLSFSSLGTVAKVLVSEGDFVKKGQLLAVLKDDTYQNTYEMALATLKQAEDAYSRLKPMYDNGNLPEIKFVEVQSGLQTAQAAATIAKRNLDDCKLYSPINGIVGKRSIEPGMSALPNLASITIVKIEKVLARVPVGENEISSIKKGQKANITIAALNNAEFTGTVEEIGVMADPLAHTYKIKIGIANNNLQIKPGMICNVVVNKLSDISGLFVPTRAVLVDEQGRNFVYAISQNKAVKKYVTVGKLLKNGVEITSGLNEGEQIVVTGQHKLVDNSLVNIVNK